MTENYAETYHRFSDDELLNLANEEAQLCREADDALRREISVRNLKPRQAPTWTGDSGEPVQSLQSYGNYRRLCKRKAFMSKYVRALMIGPFVLVLILIGDKADHSRVLMVLTLLVFLCIGLVPLYALFLNLRWAAFRCPQCKRRFGTEDECWSCGFPRGTASEAG